MDVETSFDEAPEPNPARDLTNGVVYGVRVEGIEGSMMREVRYLDKLIDELRARQVEGETRTSSVT